MPLSAKMNSTYNKEIEPDDKRKARGVIHTPNRMPLSGKMNPTYNENCRTESRKKLIKTRKESSSGNIYQIDCLFQQTERRKKLINTS